MRRNRNFLAGLVMLCILFAGTQSSFAASDEGYPNTHVNTGDQATDIVGIAKTQTGYMEPPSGYSKFGLWYEQTQNAPGFQYGEWCAMFVSWCAEQGNIPSGIIPRHAWCPTGVSIFKSLGVWHEPYSYIPQPGDIIYFDWGHVGIVSGYSNGFVHTVEGNTTNGSGQAEGVRQKSHPYNFSAILGYASPAYKHAVASISLDKEKIKMYTGTVDKVNVVILPETAPNKSVTWRSDNPSIASVDQQGNIRGVGQGSTWITATANDGGKTARCLVSVHDKVEVNIPETAKIVVNMDPKDNSKFIVSTEGFKNSSGVGGLKIPVWSNYNGQDDLVWYEATKGTNGEYSSKIDLRKHDFITGEYNIHAYVYGLIDESVKFYGNTFIVPKPKVEVQVDESIANNSYKVRVKGVSNSEGVTGVSFPTWSNQNGQDDIRWESGSYIGNDTWEATIELKNYKETYDTFYTHTYITNKAGKQVWMGATEKVVESPLKNLQVKAEKDPKDSGKYLISTEGLAGKGGVGRVSFPTWSDRNGQDDLSWHEGMTTGSGEYQVTVDVKDHGFETGNYITHAYIYGINGEVLGISSFVYDQKQNAVEISTGEVSNNSYKVRIKGMSNPEGITGVSFPTWSNQNGQDDIRWESGSYIGNDTWEVTIDLKNYKETYDTFYTHIYGTNKAGKQVMMGEVAKVTGKQNLELTRDESSINQEETLPIADLSENNKDDADEVENRSEAINYFVERNNLDKDQFVIKCQESELIKEGIRITFSVANKELSEEKILGSQEMILENEVYEGKVNMADFNFVTGKYEIKVDTIFEEEKIQETQILEFEYEVENSELLLLDKEEKMILQLSGLKNPKGLYNIEISMTAEKDSTEKIWKTAKYMGNDCWEVDISEEDSLITQEQFYLWQKITTTENIIVEKSVCELKNNVFELTEIDKEFEEIR